MCAGIVMKILQKNSIALGKSNSWGLKITAGGIDLVLIQHFTKKIEKYSLLSYFLINFSKIGNF